MELKMGQEGFLMPFHQGERTNLFIRLAVGYVFLLAGIQKWLFTERYIQHFVEMNFPLPEASVLILAITETTCAILILFNRYVQQAAFPLLVIMVVAILWAKLPLLATDGIWAMLIESRIDVIMILLLFALLTKHEKRVELPLRTFYGKMMSKQTKAKNER
jgi:uncharacterized membrane protein YphA (DoxX/SURF4 family)